MMFGCQLEKFFDRILEGDPADYRHTRSVSTPRLGDSGFGWIELFNEEPDIDTHLSKKPEKDPGRAR